ncbi:hypothetical protein LXL04_033663 [Taraxacum kok-saghyz]
MQRVSKNRTGNRNRTNNRKNRNRKNRNRDNNRKNCNRKNRTATETATAPQNRNRTAKFSPPQVLSAPRCFGFLLVGHSASCSGHSSVASCSSVTRPPARRSPDFATPAVKIKQTNHLVKVPAPASDFRMTTNKGVIDVDVEDQNDDGVETPDNMRSIGRFRNIELHMS